jgi:hypothetical protein
MVSVAKRRRVDDDEYDENGDGPFDKRYPGQKVIADGGHVRARMLLMDGLPSWMPPGRFTLTDAVRRHQATLDAYATSVDPSQHRPGQVSLSDHDVRAARSRSEFARAEWVRKLKDPYRSPVGGNGDDADGDGDHDGDGSDPEQARQGWIVRQSNAWRDPVGRGAYAGPDLSHGYGGPSGYAQGVWSAQNAIRPGSAYAFNQVEAARRKTTRESPTDAGDDSALAYSEYLDRIATDWMR